MQILKKPSNCRGKIMRFLPGVFESILCTSSKSGSCPCRAMSTSVQRHLLRTWQTLDRMFIKAKFNCCSCPNPISSPLSRPPRKTHHHRNPGPAANQAWKSSPEFVESNLSNKLSRISWSRYGSLCIWIIDCLLWRQTNRMHGLPHHSHHRRHPD